MQAVMSKLLASAPMLDLLAKDKMQSAKSTGGNFADKLQALESKAGKAEIKPLPAGDSYTSMLQFRRDILSGKNLSLQELLQYQIRASDFHLKVEMLSKVCESMLTSARRLQNGQ